MALHWTLSEIRRRTQDLLSETSRGQCEYELTVRENTEDVKPGNWHSISSMRTDYRASLLCSEVDTYDCWWVNCFVIWVIIALFGKVNCWLKWKYKSDKPRWGGEPEWKRTYIWTLRDTALKPSICCMSYSIQHSLPAGNTGKAMSFRSLPVRTSWVELRGMRSWNHPDVAAFGLNISVCLRIMADSCKQSFLW